MLHNVAASDIIWQLKTTTGDRLQAESIDGILPADELLPVWTVAPFFILSLPCLKFTCTIRVSRRVLTRTTSSLSTTVFS